MFSTTISVTSPERICSRTYLGKHQRATSPAAATNTYCDTFFDKVQYSLRFISRPLTSVFVRPPSSTFSAAYFFFCNNSNLWNTPSRSISRSLYRSLTAFLKVAEIFRASESSVIPELTNTESVSPYTTCIRTTSGEASTGTHVYSHPGLGSQLVPLYVSKSHDPYRS